MSAPTAFPLARLGFFLIRTPKQGDHMSWEDAAVDLRDLALAADAGAYVVGDYVRMRAVWRNGDGFNVRVSSTYAKDYARGEHYTSSQFRALLADVGVDGAMVDAAKREVAQPTCDADEDALTRAVLNACKLTRSGFGERVRAWVERRGLDPRLLAGEVGWWRYRKPSPSPSEAELWLLRSLYAGGPALMVPQRNAVGRIKSFTLRFVGAPEGHPKTKYAPRTFAPTRAAHGIPFVYGWPHRDRDADITLVGEGWAFGFEARQMLAVRGEARRACVFSARDAGSFARSAPYVRGRKGRVVVVPDCNEVGLLGASSFVAQARALGADAVLFDWAEFSKRSRVALVDGMDLGDVVATCSGAAKDVFWGMCCE